MMIRSCDDPHHFQERIMVSIAAMVKQITGLVGTKDVTQWENDFIASIARRNTPLTEKQIEIVERIWRKHFA